MFFANAMSYQLKKGFLLDLTKIEEQLNELKLPEIGATELSKIGWTKALNMTGSEMLSHTAAGRTLFAYAKVEKIIPAQTIKEQLLLKIEAAEKESGVAIRNKAKQQLKEDLLIELAATAFIKKTIVRGYVSHENNLIVIDTAAPGTAENFLALLRKTIGSLPVTRLTSNSDVSDLLTAWVVNGPVENFTLADCATFESALDKGKRAKFDQEDLQDETVKAHLIDNDYYVSSLKVKYKDVASFDVNEQLNIKKIKFSDLVKEKNADIDSDDAIAKFDADFCLLAGELDLLIFALIHAFNVPEYEG